ncbi:MAG: indolepyruvate oxidoreductase subunit beta family protein [Rhizobiaceae bacterium]
MNGQASPSASRQPPHGGDGLVKLAILAVGGQGGGVLSDWIVDVAERSGYRVQATSVPGVAQRTGATIYYIEMMPDRGREPVFALMPTPGDVDIVVAAELMEAGRAITRGFVTPERTTLIASRHRMFAVAEKIVPGDGRAKGETVAAAAAETARRFICFDMERIAARNGSHISASLLGGLAGSGALPFPRECYEETIRQSGRGVGPSLKAFKAAFDAAMTGETGESGLTPPAPEAQAVSGPERLLREWRAAQARVSALPPQIRDMAGRGLEKVVDYQDLAYGEDYLRAIENAVADDRAAGGEDRGFAFTQALAKHLANALCYDDVIRVADLKTRGARFRRVREDVGAGPDTLLKITEFMHPRAEEICGMMPVRLGRFVESRPRLFSWIDRVFNRGRRIRTDRPPSFAMLYMLAGLRRFRRRLWRHAQEAKHRNAWLAEASRCLLKDYDLAIEVIECRRLVKGYGDTHSRGLSKFDRVLKCVHIVSGRQDAAIWIRRLREVALRDETGTELDGAMATVRSFALEATEQNRH